MKFFLFVIFLIHSTLFSLPENASVVQGEVEIFLHPPTLEITASKGAVIEWSSFSIAENETVVIHASTVTNKVMEDNPSEILGTLISNGDVTLINLHGILFGKEAQVNATNFSADACDGFSTASIVNVGKITCQEKASLTSSEIENVGTIEAKEIRFLTVHGL
jgi:filamentous hemagglutinin family protein